MDVATAELVVQAGFCVGVAVWLIAVRLYGKMRRASSYETLAAIVPGTAPAEAMPRLVAGLQESGAKLSPGKKSGPPRLAQDGDSYLAVELPTALVYFEVHRTGTGNDSEATAVVDRATYDRCKRRTMAIVVFALMPLVIGGVSWALWTFIAPSYDPIVRLQSVQIIQIAAVLWAPFAAYRSWRRGREALSSAVASVLAGLHDSKV